MFQAQPNAVPYNPTMAMDIPTVVDLFEGLTYAEAVCAQRRGGEGGGQDAMGAQSAPSGGRARPWPRPGRRRERVVVGKDAGEDGEVGEGGGEAGLEIGDGGVGEEGEVDCGELGLEEFVEFPEGVGEGGKGGCGCG